MTTSTWPEIVGALLAGSDLTAAQTDWAMDQIMRGEASESQIAGFVVGLRAKGETGAEVGGLVAAMLRHAIPLEITQPVLDVVGTGGDQSHSVNISTMAAIVCAACGARVVKHGNRAASSSCGSADVLEALGVVIDMDAENVARCVEEVGIGFCFAPVFHPAMRHAAKVRRDLGVPTVFNILGPMANPARPEALLVGCADRRLAPVVAETLAGARAGAMVVRGSDGLDEVTTSGVTEVWCVGDGDVSAHVVDSAAFGIAAPGSDALRGGGAKVNAEVARSLLAGETSGRLGAVADAVALNSAAALATLPSTGGVACTRDPGSAIAEFLPAARQAIESGAAGALLDRWIATSQRLVHSR